MTDATSATAVSYFYGRISRDAAEQALTDFGLRDGLYLLRESVATAGNYVLSICHNRNIHHYSIERQLGGEVMITDGRPFVGPIELIYHHSQFLDGFLTKPTIPCKRPNGTAPMAWPGVTMLELELALHEEAEKNKLTKRSQLENALGPQRQKFVSTVAKRLHLEQPWYHGCIEREQAEQAMALSGHHDGKFLVRSKRKELSHALSLSVGGETKHYRIDCRKTSAGNVYHIESGPNFDNLMDLIAHYHNMLDGLLHKLTEPCIHKGYRRKSRAHILHSMNENPMYGISPTLGGQVVDTGIGRDMSSANDLLDEPEVSYQAAPVYEEPNMEKIYDHVHMEATRKGLKMLDLRDLDYQNASQLGSGQFGSVVCGTYRHQRQTIPVAIKILKGEDLASAEADLMREAELMVKLNHRHVVRMIGICRAESTMLVLELAGLGPLLKYLKQSRPTIKNIMELMHQVAQGMAYLEENKYVHRDLAARNVLLVNEHHAKISDFGMSKALGYDKQYYKAQAAGKWPIKWYAPECIYFMTFTSQSDVWSYGITLWEAMSYGEKPYKGSRGRDLISMIAEEGRRLEQPVQCSDEVYAVMHECWQRLPENRPTFKELVRKMARFC